MQPVILMDTRDYHPWYPNGTQDHHPWHCDEHTWSSFMISQWIHITTDDLLLDTHNHYPWHPDGHTWLSYMISWLTHITTDDILLDTYDHHPWHPDGHTSTSFMASCWTHISIIHDIRWTHIIIHIWGVLVKNCSYNSY